MVCVGLLVVVALLAPRRTKSTAKRAAALREAIAEDRLVGLAQARAARELIDEPSSQVRLLPAARVLITVGCWSAAAIHAFVCPEHFAEGLRFGLFFAAVSVTQLGLGALVLRSAQRRWVVISAVVNGETALLWAFVHGVGLPFGLAEAESTGTLDVIATVAELIAVAAAVGSLVHLGAARRPVSARV